MGVRFPPRAPLSNELSPKSRPFLSAQPSCAIRHIPKDGRGFHNLERYGFRLDRLRALSFLVTQDLFGKTGFHFSGSCFRSLTETAVSVPVILIFFVWKRSWPYFAEKRYKPLEAGRAELHEVCALFPRLGQARHDA